MILLWKSNEIFIALIKKKKKYNLMNLKELKKDFSLKLKYTLFIKTL